MIVNFLIDSRYGGPQMILNHLKNKINNQNKTIYFDKKNKNFFFSNLKKINKIFFIFDIFVNLFSLLLKKEKFKNYDVFLIFSLVNIVPVILGIILKKKIVWYILEKPDLVFYIIFKVLNFISTIEVICITDSLAKMLKIKKYSTYFPTIDHTYWKKKNRLKKKDKFQKILCVGNLNKIKNHIQLITYLEFSKLKYKLTIIGQKLETQRDYYAELNQITKEINSKSFNKINIYHNKKSKFIKKNLENSDIFILPSLKEGLSIALVEAMCMETLCFVSKPSNHSKIIINNKNGYEFELNKESFSRIFKKINTLQFKNKEKIIKNAKKTVKKLISKNIIVEKKIIDTLLSNHQ